MPETQPLKTTRHQEYPAQGPLSPFVRRILHSYSERPVELSLPVPPTGSPYLTFNYATPMTVWLSDNEPREAPRLFVGGQLRREFPVSKLNGQVGLLGIEFTPTGFYRLFQTDCRRLTDRMTALDQLFPQRAQKLEADLWATTPTPARVELLQACLLERVPAAVETPYLDHALELVERHRGRIGIDTLVEQSWLSARQLRRQFLKCVGIGPKHYAKIVQIKHAFAALQGSDTGELQNIAQTAGYYDQAHFIHDFQRLIGANPAAFLRHRDPFLDTYLRHHSH